MFFLHQQQLLNKQPETGTRVPVPSTTDYRYIPRQRFAALPWNQCESVRPLAVDSDKADRLLGYGNACCGYSIIACVVCVCCVVYNYIYCRCATVTSTGRYWLACAVTTRPASSRPRPAGSGSSSAPTLPRTAADSTPYTLAVRQSLLSPTAEYRGERVCLSVWYAAPQKNTYLLTYLLRLAAWRSG